MNQKLRIGNSRKFYNPRNHAPIEVLEFQDLDIARILVKRQYPIVLQRRRNIITLELLGIYEDSYNVPDKFVSETIFRLNCIKNENKGVSLREMVGRIRAYLSYHCSFYKEVNGEKKVIKFDEIVKAYKGILDKIPKEEIKKILYE